MQNISLIFVLKKIQRTIIKLKAYNVEEKNFIEETLSRELEPTLNTEDDL